MPDYPDKEMHQKRNYTNKLLTELIQNLDGEEANQESGPSPAESAPNQETFLDQLSSANPTPAGGSAAAYSGACAASLVMMVSRITSENPRYASVKEPMENSFRMAKTYREQLIQSVQDDSLAYNAFMKVLQQSRKNTLEKKSTPVENARLQTIQIPLQVAEYCLEIMRLALNCLVDGGKSMVCDSYTAGLLAEAAVQASLTNALYNLRKSPDQKFNKSIREKTNRFERELIELQSQIRQVFSSQNEIR